MVVLITVLRYRVLCDYVLVFETGVLRTRLQEVWLSG